MGITTTVRRQEWKISGEWRTVNSPSASFRQLRVCMIQLYIKCYEKERTFGRKRRGREECHGRRLEKIHGGRMHGEHRLFNDIVVEEGGCPRILAGDVTAVFNLYLEFSIY